MIDTAEVAVRAMLAGLPNRARPVAEIVFEAFGPRVMTLLWNHGVRLRILDSGERYDDASPELRRLGLDVDLWPVPPCGLYCVDERTAYIRTVDVMTVSHELSHGLDTALGGGVYRSGYDPKLREMFSQSVRFVSAYAACGLDEWFSENHRAYRGLNAPNSPWPKVSRERLHECSPGLVKFFDDLDAGLIEPAHDVAPSSRARTFVHDDGVCD